MANLKCVKCGLEVGAEKIAAGAKRCARCGTAFAELAPPAAPQGKGDRPRAVRAERGGGSSSRSEGELVREALSERRRATRRMSLAVGGAMLAGAAVCAGLFELGRRSGGDEASEQSTAETTAEAAAEATRLADQRAAAAKAEQAQPSDGATQVASSTIAKSDEAPAPPEPKSTLPSAVAIAASKPKTPPQAAVPPQETSPPLQAILAEVEPSVVTLRVRTADGERVGSGFIVGADGTIATNYHVIEGAQEVIIELGSSVEVPAEGYRAIAPRRDLALIAGPASALPERPLALETALPPKTAPVFTVGSSLGAYAGTVTDGIVSGIRQGASIDAQLEPAVTVIQTTAPVSEGNSGGPLLDGRGRVVGVTTGSAAEGQNLNFAIASQHVVELLKAQSRSPLLWAQLPAPRAKPTDLAQAAVVPPQPIPPATPPGSSEQSTDSRVAAQQIESDAKAKQGKLDRINGRIDDLAAQKAEIIAEGTKLADQLNERKADIDEVDARGREVNERLQYYVLRRAVRESEFNDAQQNFRPTEWIRQKIVAIDGETRRLSGEFRSLKRQYDNLSREAMSINGRLESQRGLLEKVDEDIEYLNMQGQIVEMGSQKFVEKLFRDFDKDKNGVLIAKEAPDKYHPVLHDAAGKNKYGVSKEQLGLFLEGFGDAPK